MRHNPLDHRLTRRSLLRYGGSLGAAVAGLSNGGVLSQIASAAGASVRAPDSLPNPKLPAGTVDEAMPSWCARRMRRVPHRRYRARQR